MVIHTSFGKQKGRGQDQKELKREANPEVSFQSEVPPGTIFVGVSPYIVTQDLDKPHKPWLSNHVAAPRGSPVLMPSSSKYCIEFKS